MGAADGGRRGGVCRHHAAAGHAIYRARAESARASSARSPPACPKSRSSPPRRRRSADATSTSRSTNRSPPTRRSARTRARRDCAVRGYLSTCFVCPFEGPVDPHARRRHLGRGCSTSASTKSRSATRSARRTPGDVLRVLGAVSVRLPLHQTPCIFTTPAAPRSPTCSPDSITA